MIDYFNLLGITNLLISFFTLYVIIKKHKISSFIFFGWVGLFIYSIPNYINFTREMYSVGDQASMFKDPSLESKLVYFLFWIGFLLSTILLKDKNKYIEKVNTFKPNLKNLRITCEIYMILYISYFLFFESQSIFILILSRWLFIFLGVIYAIEKKYFKLSLLLFILSIYSIYLPDRTLIVIGFFSIFPIMLIYNSNILKKYKFIIFISFLLLFVLVIFNKLFYNISIKNEVSFSLNKYNITHFINVLNKLRYSFEPFMIQSHMEEALKNENFDTFLYLKSIFSNLFIVPEYFGLSNDYYYNNLIANIPVEIGYGRAGSIFASTFLAFSYHGLIFFGFLTGCILISIGNFVKNSNSNLVILFSVIGGLISVYLYRNSLDNFLSFVKQLFIVYFFLKIQTVIFANSIKIKTKID